MDYDPVRSVDYATMASNHWTMHAQQRVHAQSNNVLGTHVISEFDWENKRSIWNCDCQRIDTIAHGPWTLGNETLATCKDGRLQAGLIGAPLGHDSGCIRLPRAAISTGTMKHASQTTTVAAHGAQL